MKLYVDGLRRCPEGWELARTVTAAIRLLAQFRVEEVSLDHDICHAILPGDEADVKQIYQPVCCPETFEAVAWFIAAMPETLRPVVRFHTANPGGQKKMEAVLSTFRWPVTQKYDCVEHLDGCIDPSCNFLIWTHCVKCDKEIRSGDLCCALSQL